VARQVIIHLPDIDLDQVRWAAVEDNGQLVGDISHGTLADAAEHVEGRRAVLVIPGDDVTLANARVPGGSARNAAQAVRYELEEQLADDVETLHFALGKKNSEDVFSVAVVGRDMMDEVIAQCAEAGLRPSQIVSETLALPQLDADDDENIVHWTALVDGPKTLVRLNDQQGFAIDTDMVGMALSGARAELAENKTASMVMYQTQDSSTQVAYPADIDVEPRGCDDVMGLFALGLAKSTTINLLQGEYSPKTNLDKAWKPWRWTAVLAAALAAIFFVGKWVDYSSLKQSEATLNADIAAAFKEALPGKRMVRPRQQIEVALREAGGGGGAGFTTKLHAIAESFSTQPDTIIRSFAVREGRFDLDVSTDSLPTIDKLKAELKKRGDLTMTLTSNSQEKDGWRTRLRIE